MIFDDGVNNSILSSGLNLNISTVRSALIQNDWRGENVVSPFSRLYYIKSGEGMLISENCNYKLTAGNIYLIPVGLSFSHYSLGNIEKVYLHFNILKPDGYDLLRPFGKIGVLSKDESYINEIFRLFNSPNTVDKLFLKSAFQNDISQMIEKYGISEPANTEYSDNVYRAINIIVNNPTIQLNNALIAKKLFISQSGLSKQFKKETGLSVGEYIDKMIFYNIQTILIETDEPIAEIGARFGFCDRFYLTRRFKQLFGETPAQYRKRLKIYGK